MASSTPDAFAKNIWLEDEVNKSYRKFTTSRNVNIFIGSWNVNAKPPKDDMTSYLIHDDFEPDIYVLGFQEIVDLNAVNLYIDHNINVQWEEKIAETLGGRYTKLVGRHLVGILCTVFVKLTMLDRITNIMTATCGVGIFGTGGNKGAVGISMRVFDSNVCFICSHLAAHKNNAQGRNQDFAKIMSNLTFDITNIRCPSPEGTSGALELSFLSSTHGMATSSSTTEAVDEKTAENEQRAVSACGILPLHDYVFWLGDLNYRLDYDDLESVYDKVGAEEWEYLLLKDQLITNKATGHTFENFFEPAIDFPPTYKFQPGTSDYERRPDKKIRFPAWCDRIQWRTGLRRTCNDADITCSRYNVSMDQMCSDHKPVYTFIQAALNEVDMTLKSQVKAKVMKRKDQDENTRIPQVRVTPQEIALPETKYAVPVRRQFSIVNVGVVPAQFSFLEDQNKPAWLSIIPRTGVVLPGQLVQATFEATVTRQSVRSIMENDNVMEGVVVMRLEDGPEKFITITGRYSPSCFGNTLSRLVTCHLPIRFLDDSKGAGSNEFDSDTRISNVKNLSIPKELWRLVDHIYKHGMDCHGIFESGIKREVSGIRECLDTGTEFDDHRYEVRSFGDALVRFLESFQEPIFPMSHCESFDPGSVEDAGAWCRRALMTLPLHNYNAFIYLIAFLREVLKHAHRNAATPEKLAGIFARALTHDVFPLSSASDLSKIYSRKSFIIIRHFVTNHDLV